MKQREYLKKIYYNINIGKRYGKNTVYGIDCSLGLTENGLIYWHNFGSSCEKNTLKDLEWLIKTIFKTTPEEFIKNYILY